MSLTPLELLKPTGNGGKFQIQLDQLKAIIQQKGWLDKKIAVLSIAGEFRNGKSFLSNFFIWFLRKASAGGSAQDWLQQQAQVKNGFPWRGGPERHTTGIIAWPELFLLRSHSGRPEDDVVCLLLDTQGLHDSRTSQEMNAVLFVMAAFLSSTLIFNVNGQLSGNDWGVLQQFVQFAKDATRLQSSGGANPVADKIFQQMLFLVRDWSDPDLAYGYGGGEQYLREEIEKLAGNEELGNGCNQLLSVCEQIQCFLMPHPGGQVADGSFNGAVNEIAPIFLEHLRLFVPSVLSTTAISAKKFNGMPLTCQAWLAMFKDFAEIFSSGKIPNQNTILSCFADITHNLAIQSAIKLYRDEIEKFFLGNEPLNDGQLQQAHQRCVDSAKGAYLRAKKMSIVGSQQNDGYLNKLDTEIKKIFEQEVVTKNATLRETKKQHNARDGYQQDEKDNNNRGQAADQWTNFQNNMSADAQQKRNEGQNQQNNDRSAHQNYMDCMNNSLKDLKDMQKTNQENTNSMFDTLTKQNEGMVKQMETMAKDNEKTKQQMLEELRNTSSNNFLEGFGKFVAGAVGAVGGAIMGGPVGAVTGAVVGVKSVSND